MGKASRRRKPAPTSRPVQRSSTGASRRRSSRGRSRACPVRPTGSRCARSSRPPPPRCAFAQGKAPEGAPDEVTVATVLPLAWPGLHRADGTRPHRHPVGQRQRRRVAATWPRSLLAAASRRAGHPGHDRRAGHRRHPAPAGRARHRRRRFEVTVHEGFDFWVGDSELDAEGKESLERANAVGHPDRPSWTRAAVGLLVPHRRAHPHPPGAAATTRTPPPTPWPACTPPATSAPRRAAPGCSARSAPAACSCRSGTSTPSSTPPTYEDELAALRRAVRRGAGRPTRPLTAEERRARSGLLSRQVTLR